jgi:hypothetical protein
VAIAGAGTVAVLGTLWLVRSRRSSPADLAASAALRVRHALELRRKLSGFDTFWMDESGFRLTVRAPVKSTGDWRTCG